MHARMDWLFKLLLFTNPFTWCVAFPYGTWFYGVAQHERCFLVDNCIHCHPSTLWTACPSFDHGTEKLLACFCDKEWYFGKGHVVKTSEKACSIWMICTQVFITPFQIIYHPFPCRSCMSVGALCRNHHRSVKHDSGPYVYEYTSPSCAQCMLYSQVASNGTFMCCMYFVFTYRSQAVERCSWAVFTSPHSPQPRQQRHCVGLLQDICPGVPHMAGPTSDTAKGCEHVGEVPCGEWC